MKKKKKNMFAQIMAWLALFAIVIWIVWTWILVLFSSGQDSGYGHGWWYEGAVQQNITQEDLQRIIDQSSVEVNTQPVEVNQDVDTQEETTSDSETN